MPAGPGPRRKDPPVTPWQRGRNKLVADKPVVMGRSFKPTYGRPANPPMPPINKRGPKACFYFGGITKTELRPCCGGKMNRVNFILCNVDGQEREGSVCLFCSVFKPKEVADDPRNNVPEASVPGDEQQA